MSGHQPSNHPTTNRLSRTVLFAGAGYLVWTLIILARVLPQFGSALPADAGDPLLNAAVLAWNAQHLPFTDAWWNFPAFAPTSGVATFTEHLAGLWPIASVVILLTGNPIAAYNVTFVILTVGAGVGMLLLTRYLLGSEGGPAEAGHDVRDGAAVIAGFAFAFPLFGPVQVSHIQMLAACWMPFCLLALHKFHDTGNARWLAAAALAWTLTFLSNGYFLVFFGLVLGGWLCWYLLRPGRIRHFAAASAALGAPLLLLWPVLARYRDTHAAYGFVRSTREIAGYGADVAALLTASYRLPLWGDLRLYDRAEGQLFPGVMLVVLVISASASAFSAFARKLGSGYGETPKGRPWWRTGLWVITLVALALAPLTIRTTPVALVGALVLLGSSRLVRDGWRGKSHLAFYGLTALATWLLALGPSPTFRGEPILYRAPYHLLLLLPGVNALRVPARLWTMTLLCLAVIAAFGAVKLLARRPGWRYTCVVLALLAVESFYLCPPAAVERLYAIQPPAGRVLDMPVGDLMYDIRSQYSAVVGGYETVNGYSGYLPAHYAPLRLGLAEGDRAVLDPIRRRGPVVLTFRSDDRSPLRQQLISAPSTFSWGSGATWIPLDGLPPLPHRPMIAVPIDSIAASNNADLVGNLTDPELRTHWNSGPQNGRPHELVVTLHNETAVSGVTMDLGSATNAFPVTLECLVSQDGATWQSVWQGNGAAVAVEGALSDPLRVPMRLEFDPVPARYVRLRQSGIATNRVWSIGTLTIHAPAPN